MKIENFIDNEYKEFAKYVLDTRAIPNVIDGFKSAQRKAIYTAHTYNKNKSTTTAALSGQVILSANYHHGDASIQDVISNLAADWNNNVTLVSGEGNFGSRLVTQAAAARYTEVKISPNFEKYFSDFEITEKNPDPENPEPAFYLPTIPWVLVNGIKGIAVGFACNIQPYNPDDLANACIEYLKGNKIPKLKPYYKNFTGNIYYDNAKEKWVAQGVYKLKGQNLIITDLPPGIDRESYINHLNKLEDSAKNPMVRYVDKSSHGFCFDITLKNGIKLSEAEILKIFKLESYLNENITTIDEHGHLALFDSPEDLLKHFVDYRLSKYPERYVQYVKRDSLLIEKCSAKLKFISLVLDGTISLNTKTKDNLKAEILKHVNHEYLDDCLNLKAYHFCQDEIDNLTTNIKKLESDIVKWTNIDIKQQYINELK